MLKIAVKELAKLFAFIADEQELYVPVSKGGRSSFSLWREDTEPDFNTLLTSKPAKDFFFPQSETLVQFEASGKNISIKPAEFSAKPFVLFGLKPCDAKSFELLDKVFLKEPVDGFYKNKREQCTIISLACHQPEETCFCSLFGIDAANPAADIAVWQVEGQLFWLAQTAKGQELTETLGGFLGNAAAGDEQILAEFKKRMAGILKKLPLNQLSLPKFESGAQDKAFSAGFWAKVSQACLGCGSCTYVCPTCHCYDICDFDAGSTVERFRCWDSCMYSDFTNMAHGNPRKSRLERFRQRFMHKLIYFPKNNEGSYACVGCGRCLNKCPVNMNIAKVMKNLEAVLEVNSNV